MFSATAVHLITDTVAGRVNPPYLWGMLLRLLTLLAMLIAPLAAPAAAMVPATAKAQCKDSAMHSAANRMPAGEHQGGAACCTAVPAAALDRPLPSLGSIEPLGHLPFIEQAKPIALGAGPEAEDPPPRVA